LTRALRFAVGVFLISLGLHACTGFGRNDERLDDLAALMVAYTENPERFETRNVTALVCPLTIDDLNAMGRSSHPHVRVERRSIPMDAQYKPPGSEELALTRSPSLLETQTLVVALDDGDCSAWIYMSTL